MLLIATIGICISLVLGSLGIGCCFVRWIERETDDFEYYEYE